MRIDNRHSPTSFDVLDNRVLEHSGLAVTCTANYVDMAFAVGRRESNRRTSAMMIIHTEDYVELWTGF